MVNAIAGHDVLRDIGASERVRKIAALTEEGTEEVDRIIGDGGRHC
jgi:hypothetical protein